MHARHAGHEDGALRCSDIRKLVISHVESHRRSLGDHRYQAFHRALERDDLERVHSLLVESLFVLMDADTARRLLGEVIFETEGDERDMAAVH